MSKIYQAKPSWNPANQNKTKSNQNLQNSLPIQAKNDTELDSEIDTSEYKGLPSNAIINNIQRSLNSGNYPFPL